jgi:hypothetical protein
MLEQISSKMRSPTWVIAIVALVFAMAGGAYAAGNGLTGKQKKEVEKIAKKYAGKPGAPGANGQPGAQGLQGIPGTPGTNGKDGKPGASVVGAEIPTEELECEGMGGVAYEIEGSGKESEICNGLSGENGQDAGFNYKFSAETGATDPGSGKLALNNAEAASATVLSVSETDSNGNVLGAGVTGGWITGPTAKGTLLIRKAGEPTTFTQYTITGVNKGEGGFRNIVVSAVASNGALSAEDPVTISYWGSATTTLPVGATENGTWSFSGTEAENGLGGESEGIHAVISFPIPVKAIPREQIFLPGDPEYLEHCAASAGSPAVTSADYGGELKTTVCIYGDNSIEGIHRASFDGVFKSDLTEEGLSRVGGALQFEATEPGLAYGVGGWAVQSH